MRGLLSNCRWREEDDGQHSRILRSSFRVRARNSARRPMRVCLLLGESGAGKSDLALRLIAAGAQLVADDRVELSVESNRLIARAPANLAGLIEIRNVGIIALPSARLPLRW